MNDEMRKMLSVYKTLLGNSEIKSSMNDKYGEYDFSAVFDKVVEYIDKKVDGNERRISDDDVRKKKQMILSRLKELMDVIGKITPDNITYNGCIIPTTDETQEHFDTVCRIHRYLGDIKTDIEIGAKISKIDLLEINKLFNEAKPYLYRSK